MKRFLCAFFLGAAFWSSLWLLVAAAATGEPTLALRVQTAALGAVSLLALVRTLAAYRKEPVSSHGSAAFARPEEVADLLLPAREEDSALPPASLLLGALAGRFVALPSPLTAQHGVIVGGSGTGKSFSFFLPNLAFARGVSCVVTDPKSELWHYTSGFHPSVRYAPTEPDASACLNWIPLCKDARIAELCARAIVEAGATDKQEPPWPDLETAFLSALFAHASTLSVPTPLAAYHLFTRTEPAKLLEIFQSSASPVAREQAIIFGQTHERMRGSIVPVVAAKLQFLRDPQVARFTSASLMAPDFGRLRLCPAAVYWCAREQDMARLRPLSSLFFTLLLEQLAAERVGETADTKPVPVHLFLDEFANVGVIPHFETTISLARGRGVGIWLGIQSLSQLEARYGKPNAQTILTNCATKIALHGLDVETAEYFSRAVGQKTQLIPRRTYQKKRFAVFALSTSDTAQESPRALLTGDEVRRIGTNEALVITGNRKPLLVHKYRYTLSPQPSLASPLGPARTLPVASAAAEKAQMPEPATAGSPSLPPLPDELRFSPPGAAPGGAGTKPRHRAARVTWHARPGANPHDNRGDKPRDESRSSSDNRTSRSRSRPGAGATPNKPGPPDRD